MTGCFVNFTKYNRRGFPIFSLCDDVFDFIMAQEGTIPGTGYFVDYNFTQSPTSGQVSSLLSNFTTGMPNYFMIEGAPLLRPFGYFITNYSINTNLKSVTFTLEIDSLFYPAFNRMKFKANAIKEYGSNHYLKYDCIDLDKRRVGDFFEKTIMKFTTDLDDAMELNAMKTRGWVVITTATKHGVSDQSINGLYYYMLPYTKTGFSYDYSTGSQKEVGSFMELQAINTFKTDLKMQNITWLPYNPYADVFTVDGSKRLVVTPASGVVVDEFSSYVVYNLYGSLVGVGAVLNTNVTVPQYKSIVSGGTSKQVGEFTIAVGNKAFNTLSNGKIEKSIINLTNKVTLTNLVINGDLTLDNNSDSVPDGFSLTGTRSNQTYTNGIMKFTTTSAEAGLVKNNIPTTANDKWYAFAYIKTSGSSYIDGFNSYVYISNTLYNQWTLLSKVSTSNTQANNYIGIYALQNRTIEIDYIGAINLTATFGAGNEPSKTYMDSIIAEKGFFQTTTVDVEAIAPQSHQVVTTFTNEVTQVIYNSDLGEIVYKAPPINPLFMNDTYLTFIKNKAGALWSNALIGVGSVALGAVTGGASLAIGAVSLLSAGAGIVNEYNRAKTTQDNIYAANNQDILTRMFVENDFSIWLGYRYNDNLVDVDNFTMTNTDYAFDMYYQSFKLIAFNDVVDIEDVNSKYTDAERAGLANRGLLVNSRYPL